MQFIPTRSNWQVAATHFIDHYFGLPYQERVPVKFITLDLNHPVIDYLRDHGLTVIPINPFNNSPYSDAMSSLVSAR